MVNATQQSRTRISMIQGGSGQRATVSGTTLGLDTATIAAVRPSRGNVETARTSEDQIHGPSSVAQILNAGSRFRLILSVIQDLLQQTHNLRLRASDMTREHFVQTPDSSNLFLESLTSTISRLNIALHNLNQRLNQGAFRSQDTFESITDIYSSQAVVAIQDMTLTQRLAELSSNLVNVNNRLQVLDGQIPVSNHAEHIRVTGSFSSEQGSGLMMPGERSRTQAGFRTALPDPEQALQTNSTRTNGHSITPSALSAESSEYIVRSSRAMIQDDRLRVLRPADSFDDLLTVRNTNMLTHVERPVSNTNVTPDSGYQNEPNSRLSETTVPHRKLLPLVHELDDGSGHLSMTSGILYSSHISIVHKPEKMFYKGIEYRNCLGLWLSYRGVQAPKHAFYAKSK